MPLDSWDGVTVNAESGFAEADISYILNGNAVIVRKTGKGDIQYSMSYTFCPDLNRRRCGGY